MKIALHAALAAVCVMSPSALAQPADPAPWKPVPGHIVTRWAADVKPDAPLPEYPRPTLVRDKWLNLNGLWDYSIVYPAEIDATDHESGRILVPFPYESALSGVGRKLNQHKILRYQRALSIPEDWKGSRIILHFGAVNWHAEVSVNGKKFGEHDGGYDPFSFDITDALKPGGPNTLSVEVHNPGNSGGQPRGKQFDTSHAIWYTASSGIWQTVWLEPVPHDSIDGLTITADRETGKVTVEVEEHTPESITYEAQVLHDGKPIAQARSRTRRIRLEVPQPHAWTPDDPFLYDLVVRSFKDDKPVDEVKSYFAFRDIQVIHDAKGAGEDGMGVNRILLNGTPIFQFGPLDQGFWPDGLYTAPTDAALKFDIEAAKRMGCNMIRKHVKVEPERWYAWCDKLGVLVWQDMPSSFFASKGFNEGFPEISDKWKRNFESELSAMIKAHRNHPSIVMWVPFNEGWGQNDLDWAKSVAESVKRQDPTRLVNNATGWTDMGVGDTRDVHNYPEPAMPPFAQDQTRASVLGEFGGLGLPIDGHTWVGKDNWGYRTYKTKDEVTAAYLDLLAQMPPLIAQGLCAAVYTQTTDVEIECNGWLTYDREIWKIDPDKARAATLDFYKPAASFESILAIAHEPAPTGMWKYTTTDPGPDWFKPETKPDGFKISRPGFGTKGTPGANVETVWDTPDIWLRTDFHMPRAPQQPWLNIHHDEDAEVYLNGVLAATLKGYTTHYTLVRISPEAIAALKPGKVTLAIHCHQTTGGQYIDCGIVDMVPAGAPK